MLRELTVEEIVDSQTKPLGNLPGEDGIPLQPLSTDWNGDLVAEYKAWLKFASSSTSCSPVAVNGNQKVEIYRYEQMKRTLLQTVHLNCNGKPAHKDVFQGLLKSGVFGNQKFVVTIRPKGQIYAFHLEDFDAFKARIMVWKMYEPYKQVD